MSLRDVKLKAHYVSGVDDLVHSFYIPMLEQSTLYQRRTGYFNSRALAMASRGLSGLIRKGGRMQLICSVELDEDEREVYEDLSKQVHLLNDKASKVAEMLEKPYDQLEEERLSLLAEMLVRSYLEIKIAYPKRGIYHEKVGIFQDSEGNRCAFNGSDNETPGGWLHNTESFHVFTSWDDQRHIDPEIETFDKLWNNQLPGTTVISLPEAVRMKILRYKKDDFDEGMLELGDPLDMYHRVIDNPSWNWTPELAYVFEAPRLWNNRDFAYSDVGITPFPHQDYVASTVLNGWPPRCMLCDEVGLGKTIEAGLILRGFTSAGRLDRALILAPKNILKQWQLQLLNKFNIEAWRVEGDHLEGPSLGPSVPVEKVRVEGENPFRGRPVILASSQLMHNERRLQQVLELEWDMILLDEAHHARAGGPPGRRSPNLLLQAMDSIKLQTQGLVLMTATPIQLDRKELWDLLMVLEMPGKWQDEDAFTDFYEEINAQIPDWKTLFAMVRDSMLVWGIDEQSLEQVQEEFGEADVYRLMQLVRDDKWQVAKGLDARQQDALKVLLYRHTPVYHMIFRNTRELLKQYRQQGRLAEPIADRDPQAPDIIVLRGDENDPRSELGLYHRIDEYVREYYARYNRVRKGMGFVMEVYRKRLTSSFYAIKMSLGRRRERLAEALRTGDYGPLLGLVEDEQEDSEEELPEEAEKAKDSLDVRAEQLRTVIQEELDFLDQFIDQLKNLPSDPKIEYLFQILRTKFSQGLRRVIIFSQFKDTVNYVLEYLRPSYGDKLGSYSGDGGTYWDGRQWASCSKQRIQEKFRDANDSLSILICTDAAAEGLDLQSCNTLINYDIPWNPMRIEQRIGRIDRIGQLSPKVYIHTFFYKDTVEEAVYARCLERIGNFRTTLGNLQPILLETERLIRQGAMAQTDEEKRSILSEVDLKLSKSVAEVDEDIRIFQFLNHYTPQLKIASKTVPVSQGQLENALASKLDGGGWKKDGDYWVREDETITFNPQVMDQRSRVAKLITPRSSFAKLFGTLPDIPDTFITSEGRKIHRLTIDGLAIFVVEEDNIFRIVRTFNDLSTGGGQRFGNLADCTTYLVQEMRDKKLEQIQSQLTMWKNRKMGWEARSRMYLDRLLSWRWREVSIEGITPDESNLAASWTEYLKGPDRSSTRELIEILSYRPSSDIVKQRSRGRPRKNSPRSAGYEAQLLLERKMIVSHIIQLSNMI